MALAHTSSFCTMVKAVMLPFLLMAVAAAASSMDEAASVAKLDRFSETQLGRKLLNYNLCGYGKAPHFSCAALLPRANKAACCTDVVGIRKCWDVGSNWHDKCGSCTTKCANGRHCCSGVCTNLHSDNKNCGNCGSKCAFGSVCCSKKCANLQTDDRNCGYCDNKCASGSVCCNKKCANLLTDKENCGKCGSKCAFGSVCCNKKCVNLLTDKDNCGKCGKKCTHKVQCRYGICGYGM